MPTLESPNNKFEIGSIAFAAFGDRVLIEEDEFKSGYECPSCSGLGKVPCDNCQGTGIVAGKFKCSHCLGGSVQCPECKGRGGLLAVPEISERRPTTGRIVSIGETVKHLCVGQAVLFSSYSGHTIDLDRAGHKVILRVLHESEVLCLVEGHLDLRTVRGKSEIAQFQN